MFDRSRRTRRAGYDVEGIGEGVYRINEYNVANCYLVIGSEKALLIDTGAGVNDLGNIVTSLAGNKPVEVALTTALPWHAGGRSSFGKIYLSEKEIPLLKRCTLAARKAYLAGLKFFFRLKVIRFRNCRWVRGEEPERVFVKEGDAIDLGGKTVRVYESKGITRGALSYLAVENRLLFVGDTYNPCTYLGIKRAAKTEELTVHLSGHKACGKNGRAQNHVATHIARQYVRRDIRHAFRGSGAARQSAGRGGLYRKDSASHQRSALSARLELPRLHGGELGTQAQSSQTPPEKIGIGRLRRRIKEIGSRTNGSFYFLTPYILPGHGFNELSFPLSDGARRVNRRDPPRCLYRALAAREHRVHLEERGKFFKSRRF